MSLLSSNDLMRRSYSMPLRESRSSPLGYADASTADATNGDVVVRPSQSDDGVLSNGSNKSSNSQHKLDRYGFILNMDSHGNIREDTSAAGAATTNGTKVHSDTSNINNNGGGGGKNNISGSSEGSSNATHNKNNNNNSSKTASAAAAQAAREDCLPSAAEIARTNRREHKWQVLLDDGNKQWHNNTLQNGGVGSGIGNKWAIRRRRPNLVKKRLRKGVPDSQRSAVWPVLCRVREKIQQNPGLYRELVETSVGFTGTLSTTTIQTTPTTTATTSSRSAATDKTTTANGWSRSSNGVVQGKPKESASDPGKNTAVAFNYSKSFKNIQETIERDIHRTFPRHSLFYDNKEDRETELLEGGAAGENEEDAHSTDTQDLQKGMCGVTEISSMIEELELAAPQQQATTSAGVDSSNGNGTAASSSTNNNVRMMMMIHTGNAYGDNVSFNKILQDAGGQARLRRVLKAYSTYDREIGYCQGMNFIAAMFLTLVTEEEAFWMLVSVMYDEPCRMRGLFGEGMRETHQVLYVAEKLIHQFLPRLAMHLDKETIHVTMYATQWLLTQYTSSFRFDLVTRVWDCFLFEGWKITYRVMLSLLQQSQATLLTLSFEEILAYFREMPERFDMGGAIIDEAIKIPLRRSHITKFEQEWRSQQQPEPA